MKPLREQNFYEIFEIPPDATKKQIEQAYELAKKTYGENSLASYSLFDSDERKELIRRIHLAYETLSDEERRKKYDMEIMGGFAPGPMIRTTPEPIKKDSPPTTPDTTAPKVEIFEPIDVATLTGEQLRKIRERRGIPLQEIATKTRINITYFEFLERNQYRSLPPPVYLRGYISQYASVLGLDPKAVSDRILSLAERLSGGEEN
jgi:flagellar biosynthesis protein FlhG